MGMEKRPEKDKLFFEGVAKLTIDKALSTAMLIECIKMQYQTADKVQIKTESASNKELYRINNRREISTMGSNGDQQQYRSNPQKQRDQRKHQQHRQQCRFRNYKCNQCHQKGHLKKMCQQYVELKANNCI